MTTCYNGIVAITFASGKSMPKWYSDAFLLPPKERSIVRSKTFQGIADAMAEQWGNEENHILIRESGEITNL